MVASTAFHYYRRFLHEWQREMRDGIANLGENVSLRGCYKEYAVGS